MTEKCRFENFSVHRRIKKEIDGFTIHENVIKKDDRDYLFLHNLDDCKDVANVLSVYHHNCVGLMKENEQLKQQAIEKQKHIVNLEGKIHRMRKQIRKLEELYHYRSADLKRENDKLKRQIDDIEFNCTQNRIEFDKDSLHIKDTHTEIDLKNGNIYISVCIPQIKEYFRFNYMVTGRRLSREVITKSKELIR